MDSVTPVSQSVRIKTSIILCSDCRVEIWDFRRSKTPLDSFSHQLLAPPVGGTYCDGIIAVYNHLGDLCVRQSECSPVVLPSFKETLISARNHGMPCVTFEDRFVHSSIRGVRISPDGIFSLTGRRDLSFHPRFPEKCASKCAASKDRSSPANSSAHRSEEVTENPNVSSKNGSPIMESSTPETPKFSRSTLLSSPVIDQSQLSPEFQLAQSSDQLSLEVFKTSLHVLDRLDREQPSSNWLSSHQDSPDFALMSRGGEHHFFDRMTRNIKLRKATDQMLEMAVRRLENAKRTEEFLRFAGRIKDEQYSDTSRVSNQQPLNPETPRGSKKGPIVEGDSQTAKRANLGESSAKSCLNTEFNSGPLLPLQAQLAKKLSLSNHSEFLLASFEAWWSGIGSQAAALTTSGARDVSRKKGAPSMSTEALPEPHGSDEDETKVFQEGTDVKLPVSENLPMPLPISQEMVAEPQGRTVEFLGEILELKSNEREFVEAPRKRAYYPGRRLERDDTLVEEV